MTIILDATSSNRERFRPMGGEIDSWLYVVLLSVIQGCSVGWVQQHTNKLSAFQKPHHLWRHIGRVPLRPPASAVQMKDVGSLMLWNWWEWKDRGLGPLRIPIFEFSIFRTPVQYKWNWHIICHLWNSVNCRWIFPGCCKVALDVLIGHGTNGIVQACIGVNVFPLFVHWSPGVQP